MKRAVLVGAGHAHLYSLKRAAEFVRRGFEVVLIAPEPFWYSGLATGMLGGHYEPLLDQIDAGALIERRGGRWIRDRVTQIRPAENRVELSGGETLTYDVLSLNVGSVGVPLPGSTERVTEIKPLAKLAALRHAIEQSTGSPAVVVAGAGPSGCEIAANLRSLLARRRLGGEVTLLCADTEPLAHAPPHMRAKMRGILQQQGVRIKSHARVECIRGACFQLADGSDLPFDFAVNATGLKPPPLARASCLPVDANDALLVNDRLQSPGYSNVYGGGDCIALAGHPLEKIGVYAIREAPILFHNLLASLCGEELHRFHPQRRYLQIVNLGDGTGFATWGGWHWHSRFAFLWKDWLDRRFLAKYRP